MVCPSACHPTFSRLQLHRSENNAISWPAGYLSRIISYARVDKYWQVKESYCHIMSEMKKDTCKCLNEKEILAYAEYQEKEDKGQLQ